MILIGMYDSSYTRRVAIALSLYGMPFDATVPRALAESARH